MPLRKFLYEYGEREKSLIVVNRTEPQGIQQLLENTFSGQPIRVDEHEIPLLGENLVLLVEDGDVVATSPLKELERTLLMINSDLFITGTYGLEDVELPDVLRGLDEVPFHLRGYPESNKEKLLLILISRYIERVAYEQQGGTFRASFQRLSRMSDEIGTRKVYEQLADSETTVHVYGVPDQSPPVEDGLVAHRGRSSDYRDSWFVLYQLPDGVTPPADSTIPEAVGLLAIENHDHVWDGYWTFSPDTVSALDTHIAAEL